MRGVSTKHHLCLSTKKNMRSCYSRYSKNVTGCYNPRANCSFKPQCDAREQESMVVNTSAKLIEAGENDFSKTTGCIKNCEFNHYHMFADLKREIDMLNDIPSKAQSN